MISPGLRLVFANRVTPTKHQHLRPATSTPVSRPPISGATMSAPRLFSRSFSNGAAPRARAGAALRGRTRPTTHLEYPSTKYLNTSFPALPPVKPPHDAADAAVYTPAPVTFKTLAPLIPATAASPAGLSNAFIRSIVAKRPKYQKPWAERYGKQEHAERKWKDFAALVEDRAGAVNGVYTRASKITRAGELGREIDRMMSKNGTIGQEQGHRMGNLLNSWVAGKKGLRSLGLAASSKPELTAPKPELK